MAWPIPRFNIGDTVFVCEVGHKHVPVECPDCCGERAWEAHLPCGDVVRIACPTCEHGWEGSRGVVASYEVYGKALKRTVGSVRVDTSNEPERQIEYMCHETGVGTGRIYRERELRLMREEADAELPALMQERQRGLEETQARSCKVRGEKAGRMVAHYRAQIRDAKKAIAQAERGLEREAAK